VELDELSTDFICIHGNKEKQLFSVLLFKERKKSMNLRKVLQQYEEENLTSATPRICGNVYDEQPAGVSRIVAYGV